MDKQLKPVDEAAIRATMTPEQIQLERKLTCEAIDGAIAFGYQDTNPPPSEDHWLAPYWKIGRQLSEAEAAHTESAAPLTRDDVEHQYRDGIHIASGLPRATCQCGFCAKHRFGFNSGDGVVSAAPSPVSGADERAALQWTAGTLQEIVSGRWKGAKESDKVSIGSVTKTVAQILDMADFALGRASQGVASATETVAETCKTCGGSRVVEDGEITGSGGVEFENGPIKCVKDCPDCNGHSAAPQAVALTGALEQAIRRLKKNPDNGDEIFRCGFNGAIDVVLNLLAATPAPATADARDAARYRWLSRQAVATRTYEDHSNRWEVDYMLRGTSFGAAIDAAMHRSGS